MSNYNLVGELYLSDKTLKLNGEFTLTNGNFIDGKMSNGYDQRDTLQGIMLNTKTYCFPRAENNPRNILMFAHFGELEYNHFFHLIKSGMDFEGEYLGKFENEKSKAIGVSQLQFSDSARFIDMIVNDSTHSDVKIVLSIIN